MIRARDGEANEQSNSRSRRLADEKIFFFHPKISRSFEINNTGLPDGSLENPQKRYKKEFFLGTSYKTVSQVPSLCTQCALQGYFLIKYLL
jgi:hypothetical protein